MHLSVVIVVFTSALAGCIGALPVQSDAANPTSDSHGRPVHLQRHPEYLISGPIDDHILLRANGIERMNYYDHKVIEPPAPQPSAPSKVKKKSHGGGSGSSWEEIALRDDSDSSGTGDDAKSLKVLDIFGCQREK